jgi:hypothetical protein
VNEERPPKGPIDSIHAGGTESHYTTSPRPLPQERHADLGIVDDGHAVGADL